LIVVLGGAGFVGSHVVERYSSLGEKVRVVDNRSRADLLNTGQNGLSNWEWVQALRGVEMVEASILDVPALTESLEGADGIVHAAGQTAVTVSVDDPRTDFMVNALGTLNVLEAQRRVAPEASLVFCSTNKVYGGNVNELPTRKSEKRYELEGDYARGIPESLPIDQCEHSPYGVSKTSADLYVQEYGYLYGMRCAVFRMSCIYGPRQWGVADQGWVSWFVRAILERSPITVYGDGKQIRDLLYVSDLVTVIEKALSSQLAGEVFNIGGGPGNTLSVLEAIQMIEELTGLSATIRYSDWRPSDQRAYVSDVRKAHATLGWKPTISPPEGIRRLVDWLADSVSAPALNR
jgi:CDP-paratose 2-epimerase